MMYNEFLTISKEDYNTTTGEMYMKEIEPVYQCSPESLFKDKKDFVEWWRNNKEMCKWMSSVLRMKDNMQKDCQHMVEQKYDDEETMNEQQKEIEGLKKDIEGMQRGMEEKENYWKEQLDSVQLKANEELLMLKVRVLFGKEDELKNELKIAMFDNYESIKKFAEEKGII